MCFCKRNTAISLSPVIRLTKQMCTLKSLRMVLLLLRVWLMEAHAHHPYKLLLALPQGQ